MNLPIVFCILSNGSWCYHVAILIKAFDGAFHFARVMYTVSHTDQTSAKALQRGLLVGVEGSGWNLTVMKRQIKKMGFKCCCWLSWERFMHSSGGIGSNHVKSWKTATPMKQLIGFRPIEPTFRSSLDWSQWFLRESEGWHFFPGLCIYRYIRAIWTCNINILYIYMNSIIQIYKNIP